MSRTKDPRGSAAGSTQGSNATTPTSVTSPFEGYPGYGRWKCQCVQDGLVFLEGLRAKVETEGAGTVARTRHTDWRPTDNHTRTDSSKVSDRSSRQT